MKLAALTVLLLFLTASTYAQSTAETALGQILIVTAGSGRVQRWGGAVEEIRPGDVVRIPPGQKHWHGASPDTPMTHIAIQEPRDGKTVDWLEKVSDRQYGDFSAARSAASASGPVRDSSAQPTQDELIETITHLAFYAGWPSAITATSVAREVFQKN